LEKTEAASVTFPMHVNFAVEHNLVSITRPVEHSSSTGCRSHHK